MKQTSKIKIRRDQEDREPNKRHTKEAGEEMQKIKKQQEWTQEKDTIPRRSQKTKKKRIDIKKHKYKLKIRNNKQKIADKNK